MNTDISEALKEVYTLTPSGIRILDTLQISHSDLAETLYLVKDRQDHILTTEDGQTFTFVPTPFRFLPPANGKDGFQNISISIDNVGQELNAFINRTGEISREPIEVTYRIFHSDDSSQPQNKPLVLYLTDLKIDAFEVTGQASFTNIINQPYPNEYYDRNRFAGLGG